MKLFEATYTVEGNGYFPMDMLRYDSSHPKNSEDAHALQDPQDRKRFRELRQVTLVYRGARRWWTPTVDRWVSFGWNVVDGSVKEAE